MLHLASSLLLLVIVSCPPISCQGGMRVDIDEETWPEVLAGGRWFIKFYAPWCEACQTLAPVWQSLAASEGLPRDVRVGQVDVTRNEALAGMFLVTGLPSLYILHDGQFWQYRGERSLPVMLRHVQLAEYTRLAPLPWYRAPDALHMRALGRLIQAAVRLKKLHTHLVEVRHLPSALAYVVLAVVTLAGGLLAGLGLVCLCDLLGARRSARQPGVAVAADKASGDGEGDAAEKPTGMATDEGDAAAEDSDDLAVGEGQPPGQQATAVRRRGAGGIRKEAS